MSHALKPEELRDAFRQSFALLCARPVRWAWLTIVFLVVVEGLMFVPYVGFVVKIAAASLFGAQFLRMFADVEAGGTPRFRTFAGALSQPFDAQWPLVVSGLAPFVAGIVYLAAAGDGWTSVEFFFGHLTRAGAPSIERFFVFKIVMTVVGAAATFVAGVVVLRGGRGVGAPADALRAGLLNVRVLLMLFALSAAFEALQAGISLLPLAVGLLATLFSLVLFLAWTLALSYALSRRALDDASLQTPVAIGRRPPADPA